MSPIVMARKRSSWATLLALVLSAAAIFAVTKLSQSDASHLTGLPCGYSYGGYSYSYAAGYHGCVVPPGGGGGGSGAPTTTATATATAAGTATATASPGATATPCAIDVYPNDNTWQSNQFNAVTVFCGGTAQAVWDRVAFESGRPVVIIWFLVNNNWQFYIQGFAGSTLQNVPGPISTVYVLIT